MALAKKAKLLFSSIMELLRSSKYGCIRCAECCVYIETHREEDGQKDSFFGVAAYCLSLCSITIDTHTLFVDKGMAMKIIAPFPCDVH